MEPGLDVVRGGERGARQLAFRALDVERQDDRGAAPLQPRGRLALVGDEAVDTRAQEGAEACAGGIEAIEESLLEGAREEALGQVLRFRAVGAPAPAQVLVHGTPVRLGQVAEGLAARLTFTMPGRAHHALSRGRKGAAYREVRLGRHGVPERDSTPAPEQGSRPR